MKNIIILGSGRSGTSMVAGLFAKSGYFFGGIPYRARYSNPKGFFETKEVNGINETIIAQLTPQRPPVIGDLFFRKRPTSGQRWLDKVALDVEVDAPLEIQNKISRLVENEPYCFKDPRFCYTLPVWRPHLKNHLFICVFRDPATTVESILKECSQVQYLSSLSIDETEAMKVWVLMYKHILEKHSREGEWLFVHYDQAFDGDMLRKISTRAEVDVDICFPEVCFNRTVPKNEASKEANLIYEELCSLSCLK